MMRTLCFLVLILVSACQADARRVDNAALINQAHQGPNQDRTVGSNMAGQRDGHW